MPSLQITVLLTFLENNPNINSKADLIAALDNMSEEDLFLLSKQFSYAWEELESAIETSLPGRGKALLNANYLNADELKKIHLNKKEIFFNSLQKISVILTSITGIGLSVLSPFKISGWSNVSANGLNLLAALCASGLLAHQSYHSLRLNTKAVLKNLAHKRIHHIILSYIYQKNLTELEQYTQHALSSLGKLGYTWDSKATKKLSAGLPFTLTKQDLLHVKEGLVDFKQKLQHHVKVDSHGQNNDARLQALINSTIPAKYYTEPADFTRLEAKAPNQTLPLTKWLVENSRQTTEMAFLAITGAAAGNFVFHGMLMDLKEGALSDYQFFSNLTTFLDSPIGVVSFLVGSLLFALLIGTGTLYNKYRDEARTYQVEKEKKKIKFDEENISTILHKTLHVSEVIESLREVSPLVEPFYRRSNKLQFFSTETRYRDINRDEMASPSTRLTVRVDDEEADSPLYARYTTSDQSELFSTEHAGKDDTLTNPLLPKKSRGP